MQGQRPMQAQQSIQSPQPMPSPQPMQSSQPIQSSQPMQNQQAAPGQQFTQQGGQSAQFSQGGQPVGQFFYTQNYLPGNVRESSASVLAQCLADATDLLTQIKTAHWNVKGIDAFQLHELFEDIAEDLEEDIDEIAERATALGASVSGTVRTSAANSRIPELPTQAVDGIELVELLANRLSTLDAILGDSIRRAQSMDDIDTVDLLNDVSRRISKNLWLLEAHLQSPGPSRQMGGTQSQTQGGMAQSQQLTTSQSPGW